MFFYFRVKSERINAIRKQYDAFLEEDRKRRDRNEYILDRLDRMRLCTSMVPAHHNQTVSKQNVVYVRN